MAKIGIDLEGTLADIHTPFIQAYNTKHGTNYTINDITSWGFTEGNIKATTEEFFDIVCDLWVNSPKKILPTESYIGRKIALLQETNTVDILTSAMVFTTYKNYGKDSVKDWLNMRKVPPIELNDTKGAKNKLEFGRDIIIDDSPALAETAQKEKTGFILLYDRPWNQNIKDDQYVKRIFSLSEVLKYAKKF